jgi:UDP:flavonoid glycosyltransferase YjiC (YdhE family)
VIENYFVDAPYFLAADPVIASVPPDWQRFDITATGPWFYQDPAPLDAEVEAFLRAGPPPVYIGFGSMVAKDAARVTRAIVEGTRDRRVLLARGWAGLGVDAASDDMLIVHGPVPHAKLFPRLAAVVHHGGSGTMANALRAGVPQVIVPHIMDQYYWAHRLETLGIAPPGVPIKDLDASRLARAIDATLALPSGPRNEAAARLASGDGAARAVAFVEGMMRQSRP